MNLFGSKWKSLFQKRLPCVYITFSGMWLEAILHLLIVRDCGLTKYKKVDRDTYEKKLEALGVVDHTLNKSLKDFRNLRREVLHEKAYFGQKTFKIAQDEAQKVRAIIQQVKTRLSEAGLMQE